MSRAKAPLAPSVDPAVETAPSVDPGLLAACDEAVADYRAARMRLTTAEASWQAAIHGDPFYPGPVLERKALGLAEKIGKFGRVDQVKVPAGDLNSLNEQLAVRLAKLDLLGAQAAVIRAEISARPLIRAAEIARGDEDARLSDPAQTSADLAALREERERTVMSEVAAIDRRIAERTAASAPARRRLEERRAAAGLPAPEQPPVEERGSFGGVTGMKPDPVLAKLSALEAQIRRLQHDEFETRIAIELRHLEAEAEASRKAKVAEWERKGRLDADAYQRAKDEADSKAVDDERQRLASLVDAQRAREVAARSEASS